MLRRGQRLDLDFLGSKRAYECRWRDLGSHKFIVTVSKYREVELEPLYGIEAGTVIV